jgi:hypothetical protein
VTGVGWVALFGSGAPTAFLRTLEVQSTMVSELSVPYLLGWLLGEAGATPLVRLLLQLSFLLVATGLLWRTLRGADWVNAAGWSTFALLLSTAWLMPYYLVWLLPLAALGSRRLAGASLLACLAVGISRIGLLFA